jgi:cell division protein FtsL
MSKKNLAVYAACAGLAFLFLWEQVQATRVGYEVGKAQKLLREQTQTNAHLRVQLARLQAPERLAREAEARLQMLPPDPARQIFLGQSPIRESGRVGDLSFLFRQ